MTCVLAERLSRSSLSLRLSRTLTTRSVDSTTAASSASTSRVLHRPRRKQAAAAVLLVEEPLQPSFPLVSPRRICLGMAAAAQTTALRPRSAHPLLRRRLRTQARSTPSQTASSPSAAAAQVEATRPRSRPSTRCDATSPTSATATRLARPPHRHPRLHPQRRASTLPSGRETLRLSLRQRRPRERTSVEEEV